MRTVPKQEVQHTGGEEDGTAPTESSETSNQPSHFMKLEKTQLSFFSLYQKGRGKECYWIRSCVNNLHSYCGRGIAETEFCNVLEIQP